MDFLFDHVHKKFFVFLFRTLISVSQLRRVSDNMEHATSGQWKDSAVRIFHVYENLPMAYAVFKYLSGGAMPDLLTLYANGRFAAACVRGMQAGGETAACPKHFVGYSACEGGRDYSYTEFSARALREWYLPPFEAGIRAGLSLGLSNWNTSTSS